MQLAGAQVLITGASRGIGEAMARRFADRGSHVVLVARSEAPLRALAAELAGTAVVADLADPGQLRGLVARAEAAAGAPVDVLVNNAGLVEVGPLAAATAESLADQIAVDLVAPAELIRQVLPGMLARGRGHLVGVSSLQSTTPTPGCSAYGASKAGLSQLHAILRLELAGTPVGATLVSPGPVATELWDELEGLSYLAPFLRRLDRLGARATVDPEALAAAVVDAVAAGRRHVRAPRRAVGLLWFGEVPRRLVELAMRGVRFDQPGPRR